MIGVNSEIVTLFLFVPRRRYHRVSTAECRVELPHPPRYRWRLGQNNPVPRNFILFYFLFYRGLLSLAAIGRPRPCRPPCHTNATQLFWLFPWVMALPSWFWSAVSQRQGNTLYTVVVVSFSYNAVHTYPRRQSSQWKNKK